MGWIFGLKASVTHSLPIYVSSVGLKLSGFGRELPQIMELYSVTASLIAKAVQSKSLLWPMRKLKTRVCDLSKVTT